MKILAVDTTGASASVAVQDTEKGKQQDILRNVRRGDESSSGAVSNDRKSAG